MQTMTSREFNQHTHTAQKRAHQGPLLITNRGKPDLVILDYKAYQALLANKQPKPSFYEAWLTLSNKLPTNLEVELDIPQRSIAQRPTVEFD